MSSGLVHEHKTEESTVEWYMPEWLFKLMGVEFDQDVASPGQQDTPWIPARQFITREQDSFTVQWNGRVWMNHPYSERDMEWVDKFLQHGNGIGICHARTDVMWCKKLIQYCDLVVLTKRIKAVDKTGNPPMRWNAKKQKMVKSGPGCGQMLFACGLDNVKAIYRIANDSRIVGTPVKFFVP